MISFALKFGPLTLGLFVFLIGLLFGLTDWAWRLEGRPSESYPEMFYLGIVAPTGLLLTLLGLVWWLWLRAKPFGRSSR